MRTIEIDHPTPHQLRKLKQGGKIRLKHGSGFNLLVHPETYNLVAKAFNKGNAYTYGLSQEELQANQGITAGVQRLQKFDSAGNPLADTDPRQMTNVGGGPTALPSQQGATGQGLRDHLGHMGNQHIHRAKDFAGQVDQAKMAETMNKHLGTNFDYMGRAGIEKALADSARSKISEMSINTRFPTKSLTNSDTEPLLGGSGLHRTPDRMMMGKGVVIHHHSQVVPPAYESQPYNENFLMNNQLPKDFQIHIKGEGVHPHSQHHHQHMFPHSVVMPPAYTSKAEDVDYIRQSTKNPDSKPEAKYKLRRKHPAEKGEGLYASGRSGKGLYI